MGTINRLFRRASGFDPRAIANLAIWFDAQDSTTITTVSGAVSAWNSKVGGFTATQTTANNRPTFNATGINNKPAVSFDGSNDQLTSTYNANAITGFVTYAAALLPALSMVDTKANFEPVWYARGSVATGLNASTSVSPNKWTLSHRSALYNSSVGGDIQNSTQVVLASISASTLTVRVNGVQGTAAGTYTAGSGETSAVFQLGQDGAQARYYEGMVGELLMFTRALGTRELVRIERYLARKWGVTL